ncbi:MAG: PEP-CTERM sorting domain-containing protein [Pseudomonadota bacterium]
MKNKVLSIGLFLVLFGSLSNASALQFTFDNITNNDPFNAATGEAQLFMDVDLLGSQVMFTFTNKGDEASSICDIYFDDDVPLLNFVSFSYFTSGVSFTVGARPGNLPGGKDPLYAFSSDYDYDSASPVQPEGINPGESMGILFDFSTIRTGGGTYTFNDLLASLDSGAFRVGIHVQGFANGGSESFITTQTTETNPVPEPATLLLFGIGLIGLAKVGKKRFLA